MFEDIRLATACGLDADALNAFDRLGEIFDLRLGITRISLALFRPWSFRKRIHTFTNLTTSANRQTSRH